jgi:hypothetical protein
MEDREGTIEAGRHMMFFQMVGAVYGADGPGIRFVSKHVEHTGRVVLEIPCLRIGVSYC